MTVLDPTTIATPLGELALAGSAAGLSRLRFADRETLAATELLPPLLDAARDQLAAYFAGDLLAFDLPLDLAGTPFQRAVWAALQAVPYGQTASYAEIAARVGRPNAVRAVGAAVGQTP